MYVSANTSLEYSPLFYLVGAYEPRWFMKQEHMNPQDAVEFMDAVQAKKALAIHWGTFAL